MPPYPAASTSSAAPSTTSTSSDATPKNDHRILIVVVILGIVATLLIAYIVYITFHLKRRQSNGEDMGPYQGTLLHTDHPATHIIPFGAGGPHSGRTVPQYKHNPGEDMRIAIRRPDGAWHFADSRTPFTPAGVADIDILPSPMSSATSLISFNSRFPSTKAQEAQASRDRYKGYDPHLDFEPNPTVPPPPAYHREHCRNHFDDTRSPP